MRKDMPPGPSLKKARDPVCGMDVDPHSSKYSLRHKEQTYFFCCLGCKEKFSRDPESYLGAVAQKPPPLVSLGPSRSKATAPKQAGLYTCPMHPEVRHDGPGACPRCGMALDPWVLSLDPEENTELRDMTQRFWVSAALSLPVFVLAMTPMITGGGMFWGRHLVEKMSGIPSLWTQLVLASGVVLWGGLPFFRRGWSSIKMRSPNMFSLISLGTGTAYLYSVAAVMAPDVFPDAFRENGGRPEVYFEAASVIVTLVLLGQVLELKARLKTGAALRELMEHGPQSARRVHAGGEDEDIRADEIRMDDHFRIRSGEKIPADGLVVEGSSFVDESMVSGEALPVHKKAGDFLIGGTLNGQGTLVMKAQAFGENSLLSGIIRSVSEAQRSKAPIQKIADQVSGYFVPAVILISFATFVLWGFLGPPPRMGLALVNAVAVLIVACPCALGLATPLSIMVAMGRGAGVGILFRHAEAIETLHKMDTLVFDKTGTLTEGHPKLIQIVALEDGDEKKILSIAAGLESGSDHPMARAILSAAAEGKVRAKKVKDFVSLSGKGVAGVVEGKKVLMGSLGLLDEYGISRPAPESVAEAMRREGQSVMVLCIDGKATAYLGVADPIKSTTLEAVQELKKQGIRLILASGDNLTTVEAVARKIGLGEVWADLLPNKKAELVKKLQEKGNVVAMAGDGVNDAPALAQADVGIAMGGGSDVAKETAGLTLVRGDLRGILRAQNLSRAAMGNIKQNLFLAFVYNALGVPVAGGALYPFFGILLSPMIAAAAMSFSSVSVIGNALRLTRAKI